MALLHDAFIYLFAAVVSVPIAHRLGLGSVLGYLIAGILIGPVLGIVGTETKDIQHFAEFGVVMMLFVVGLELQPKLLWKMRHRLLGLGGLQVLLTSLVFAGICLLLFQDHWQGALAIGMILALSSTAIVLQTLNEKNLMKTDGGQASFAVLLFQDMAVIPMLAIFPLLAVAHGAGGGDAGHGNGVHHSMLSSYPAIVQTLIIMAIIGAIILSGRFIIQPVFRFIAKSHLREMFTAAALLLVVGIALLMELIGLSPALGTFLAGVVLSGSDYRHELESDIEPFKGLLLGLFFITVGAGINFALLFANGWMIFGLAIGLMLIKFGILFVLAKIFKLAPDDRWLFALSLAQAGEFAFVLLGFAKNIKAIDLSIADNLTLIVAITMLLTPLLFILFDKVIAPKLIRDEAKEADKVDVTSKVIIAGMGRFGQISTRVLRASGFEPTVLDFDAETIEMVKKYGHKTYYGDATRPELLHAAGMEKAQVFIATIDDPEGQIHMVKHVKDHYPHVKILARARNRHDIYKLEKAGANFVIRETFESALKMANQALMAMGLDKETAHFKTTLFQSHDEGMIDEMRPHWTGEAPDQDYIDKVRGQIQDLKNIMQADKESRS